jgi:hypothetical protein
MAAPWTNLATRLLADRMAADRKFTSFDPTVLFEIIRELVAVLSKCKPDPSEGLAYLEWQPSPRPLLDWLPWAKSLKRRLWDHRQKINSVMYAKWKRTGPEFEAFLTSMWDAVDAGGLSFNLVAGMYQEARR